MDRRTFLKGSFFAAFFTPIVVKEVVAKVSEPEIPMINMVLESKPIVAKSRKLKAKWSVEAAEDLESWHSIEAEQELINQLAKNMMQEIDKEITEDFSNISLPLVRRSFPKLIAQDLVSVQPMPPAKGLQYYFK